MDLVAALSNQETAALYQRLTKRNWPQAAREQAKRSDRSRDGKLKFGTVSTAALAVLAEAGRPLRFIEIHQQVEARLGFPVSRSSVKEFLSAEIREGRKRFVRIGHGLYRLS